jgi:hypothetical protein
MGSGVGRRFTNAGSRGWSFDYVLSSTGYHVQCCRYLVAVMLTFLNCISGCPIRFGSNHIKSGKHEPINLFTDPCLLFQNKLGFGTTGLLLFPGPNSNKLYPYLVKEYSPHRYIVLYYYLTEKLCSYVVKKIYCCCNKQPFLCRYQQKKSHPIRSGWLSKLTIDNLILRIYNPNYAATSAFRTVGPEEVVAFGS